VDQTGWVTVVTGAPGAGKSTVARQLAERFSPSVHLHTDDFWAAIKQGAIAPYLPEAHRQNEIVVAVLAQAAFGYARGGYHVIVDGVVGPWFLPPYRAAAAATGVPLHYVVLRPDEGTTLHRAAARGADALVDPGPVREMYRQFTALGALEPHAIDTTGWSVGATVGAVAAAVSSGRYASSGGSGRGL
jgi:predicted kinase